jgi:hypothetical protein
MNSTEIGEIALERKKEKVLEIVVRACEAENIPLPKINFQGCPEETDRQLAHYHPDEHKVCISETQLYKLSMGDIEKTTIHEIAHFFVHDHGSEFQRKNTSMRAKVWRPGGGVMYVDGTDSIKKTKKPKQKRLTVNKTTCNYRLCGVKAGLRRCLHCKGYFCEAHFEPLISTTPYYMWHVLSDKDYDKWKKYNYDWNRKENEGHPCSEYTTWWNDVGRHSEKIGDTDETKIVKGNSLSDAEQEALTNEAYVGYPNGFGDGGYSSKPNDAKVTEETKEGTSKTNRKASELETESKPKRKVGFLRKFKDFLGII